MMIPLIEGRLGRRPRPRRPAAGARILPAVWSFLLALRERGLGSAWTTLHLAHEKEVAELLGIPYDTLHPRPASSRSPTRRAPTSSPPGGSPLERLAHFDRW